jgi:hypothetical protein
LSHRAADLSRKKRRTKTDQGKNERSFEDFALKKPMEAKTAL